MFSPSKPQPHRLDEDMGVWVGSELIVDPGRKNNFPAILECMVDQGCRKWALEGLVEDEENSRAIRDPGNNLQPTEHATHRSAPWIPQAADVGTTKSRWVCSERQVLKGPELLKQTQTPNVSSPDVCGCGKYHGFWVECFFQTLGLHGLKGPQFLFISLLGWSSLVQGFLFFCVSLGTLHSVGTRAEQPVSSGRSELCIQFFSNVLRDTLGN
jgi:hypothetical protein